MKCEIINHCAKKEDVETILDIIRNLIERGTNHFYPEEKEEYDELHKRHYIFGLAEWRAELIVSEI